mgnify:CR=1 FL=1
MYDTQKLNSVEDYSDNNKRICASVLAKFYEEETLIWDSEEEVENRETISNWLIELAPFLFDELEGSFINFVNEGEEVWR